MEQPSSENIDPFEELHRVDMDGGNYMDMTSKINDNISGGGYSIGKDVFGSTYQSQPQPQQITSLNTDVDPFGLKTSPMEIRVKKIE